MLGQNIYFFIGTEVELIKEFFVLKELQDRKIPYKLILSGQNDVAKCVFYPYIDSIVPRIQITSEPKTKSAGSLFVWFLKALLISVFRLRKEFSGQEKKNTFIFVHGDTITTLMGTIVAKLYGLQVVHIEGGYRSYNFLQPFPEEICRYLSGLMADVHFVAYDGLLKNIKDRRGPKISTKYNTFIESLNYALAQDTSNQFVKDMQEKKYFMLVCHRQENIYNRAFMTSLMSAVTEQTRNIPCLFVLHKSTELALLRYGMLDEIKANKNIIITPRLPYYDFIKVLGKAEFIISDGGGNQQECYYWGKPILIIRNVTEGSEGLGENALLMGKDFTNISNFIENYDKYQRPRISIERRPSTIIADWLQESR